MTVRWDRLPTTARPARPRRTKPDKLSWRCEGVRGCGEISTSYAAAERHATAHGGARIAVLVEQAE